MRFFFDGVPDPKDSKEDKKVIKSTSQSSPINLPKYQKRIKSGHPDYLSNKCDKCHDKSSANMLKGGTEKFCFSCHQHEQKTFTGRYVHGPVAVYKCASCHLPHSSMNRYLLKKGVKDLCYECHQKGRNKVFKSCDSDRLCTDCHLPHVSANKYFIKNKI